MALLDTGKELMRSFRAGAFEGLDEKKDELLEAADSYMDQIRSALMLTGLGVVGGTLLLNGLIDWIADAIPPSRNGLRVGVGAALVGGAIYVLRSSRRS